MACITSSFPSTEHRILFFRPLIVMILLVLMPLFAVRPVESQAIPLNEKKSTPMNCETGEVAGARTVGSLWLADGGSIDTNEWTFCDGVFVFERATSNEDDNDFRENLANILKSNIQVIHSGHIINENKSGMRYLLRSKSDIQEWILIIRIGTGTNTFRGKSLVHLMLLERLRYCEKGLRVN